MPVQPRAVFEAAIYEIYLTLFIDCNKQCSVTDSNQYQTSNKSVGHAYLYSLW